MIQSSVFKSYDIRGIYPSQLDANTAYLVGRAFVKHTGAKKVAIGYDARLSSPELFENLAKGLTSQGADVYTLGQVPTEGVYFAVGNYDFDSGIMVTASHNPKEYNGFKMLKKTGNDIQVIRGKDLLPVVEENVYEERSEGKLQSKDILLDYKNFILQFKEEEIKPCKIVIDTSNGVMGKVIEMIKGELPLEIIPLNFNPDGNFPNHSPNPLEEGSSDQISKEIQQQKADFGVMFDGDADRIFLVDERGVLISSDVSRLLLAKHFLQKNPGSAIVYDLIASKAVPEFIKKWGGVPVKAPVGFVNIREELIKHRGAMGGEVSGHYCFKDYFYMDSGMIAFITFLQIISKGNAKLSEIAQELSPYAKSPVVNFEISNQKEVLEKVKEKYVDGKQDYMDGVTVEYKDWWFNLRPSNTEPLIKLTIEADTQGMLESKKRELSEFINSFRN